MAFGDFLFGTKPSVQQLPFLNPQQQQFQSQLLNQAQGLLGQLGKPTNIQPFLQQARENFSSQTIPSLAERFTSLGQGSQRSSAFQGALGQAASGLESNLAGLQSQTELGDQQRLQSLLGGLLGPALSSSQYTTYQPGTQGFLPSLASSISPLLGFGVSSLLGSLGQGAGSLPSVLTQSQIPQGSNNLNSLVGLLNLLRQQQSGGL